MVEDKANLGSKLEEKKVINISPSRRKSSKTFQHRDKVRKSNRWSPVLTHPCKHHDLLILCL